jgi:hypothetical protein
MSNPRRIPIANRNEAVDRLALEAVCHLLFDECPAKTPTPLLFTDTDRPRGVEATNARRGMPEKEC